MDIVNMSTEQFVNLMVARYIYSITSGQDWNEGMTEADLERRVRGQREGVDFGAAHDPDNEDLHVHEIVRDQFRWEDRERRILKQRMRQAIAGLEGLWMNTQPH